MSRFRKISFILILLALSISGFFGLNLPANFYAEDNGNIVLSVQKITYTAENISKDKDGNDFPLKKEFNKIGELSSGELYYNDFGIDNSKSIEIKNNEVVSLDTTKKETVLVSLKPNSEYGAIIKILNPSLKLNGTNISVETISVGGNLENRVFIMALDLSKLKDTLANDIDDTSGKYEFTFNYSYTTNGNNVISETKSFNFYLIDENEFFSTTADADADAPKIDKIASADKNDENNVNDLTYYYNYQVNDKPTLIYNPFKFKPTIKFTYNETYVTLTTELIENNTKVKVLSSDEKIISSKILDISSNTVELELNRLGQYVVNYDLVINNDIISNQEQLVNLTNYPRHTLYIYGFEAYYSDYTSPNMQGGYNFKQFHNENYKSDFTYTVDSATNLEAALENIDLSDEFINSIASTNQAPVKLDAYISSLTEAKWAKLNDNFTIIDGTEQPYSNSKRFGSDEENGIFAVFLKYKFTNNSKDQTQLIIFKIENDTPRLSYTHEDESSLPSNKFTNKNVKVSWTGITESPFSVDPKVSVTVNGTTQELSSSDSTGKVFSESGEYLITIKYGINHVTSVEKTFTIDKEEISFDVYSAKKQNQNYIISNKIEQKREVANGIIEYQTNAPFSIFTLKKAVENNEISVKYEYLPLEDETTPTSTFTIIDGKLYIYNNKVLKTLYSDLDYLNKKLNNFTSFTELKDYDFNSNISAVVTNNGLYHFIISDKAQNTKELYVLLDESAPVVLHTNAKYEGNLEDWLTERNNASDLTIKTNGINFVSNDYSLIVGNGKYIQFNTDNASDFAKKYYNLDTISGAQTIAQNYENFSFAKVSGDNYSDNVVSVNNDYNIASITAPEGEIEVIFKASFELNGITYSREFDLNTDKNQILIYGYNEIDGYFRVYKDNITNSKYLYIRFIDEYTDNYKLASLTLDFYPFEDSIARNISGSKTKTIDLLAIKENCNITPNLDNSILTGGFITTIINPTYLGGEYITTEGKYVLTKTYDGYSTNKAEYPQGTQKFYVDRTKPIEKLNDDLTIGDHITFNLDGDDAILSAKNILNYILNSQNVVTNKLPITSSINTTTNKKYSSLDNFIIYYEIIDAYNEIVYTSYKEDNSINTTGYSFARLGTYTFRIYDNSGYVWYDADTETKTINKKANYIEFSIELTNPAPTGNFIIDGNEEIVETESSTNSNSLSFTFSDSASEYLYDIDIYNIKLTKDNTIILQTFKEQNTINSRYSFNLNDGTIVYYESTLGNNVFKLIKTSLSSNKIPNNTPRYSYTLTIIDPSIDSALANNGKSLEGCYKLNICYNTANHLIVNSKSKEYIIYIDHTAPYTNVNKFIDNDQFLTEAEKEILKQSVANKDRTSEINFENYAFIINEVPSEVNFLDTANVYIRKYNKYKNETIDDYQSIVYGDPLFDTLTTSQYKFDVNLTNGTEKIYSSTDYNKEDLNTFFNNKGNGFYEIIEIDAAQNYTIYSVYYNNEYPITINYSYNSIDSTADLNNNNVEVNSLGFKIDEIITNDYDYLNVNVSINGNMHKLKYLPFNITNSDTTYFISLSNLITHINNLIESDVSANKLGSQYIIEISNRIGNFVKITNNTPNELLELDIVDYSNYFTVKLPSNNNATYVKNFYVYPVIDGAKGAALVQDSNGNSIPTIINGETFTFTKSVSINNVSTNVSIYYLVWTDNFGRTQEKVKTIGVTDTKYIDFENYISLEHAGVSYTANPDTKLVYNSNLYSLKVTYQILPSLEEITMIFTSIDKQTEINANIEETANGIRTINLLQIVKVLQNDNILNSQVKFKIELTDLSTLTSETNIYILTYVYYPTLPSIDFIDSSSNTLEIEPITLDQSNTISTSKNVTLSYVNNTLFDINISATRTYKNELNQDITKNIEILQNEFTFTELGNYEIIITNELGKVNTYRFSIKAASNKTYSVYTNELNMSNFEITSSPIKINYNNNTFETYYSIYDMSVEVNTDFNLSIEELDGDEISFPNTTFYQINKLVSDNNSVVYKYVALVNVDYSSNYLNIKTENSSLEIYKGIDIENKTNNLAKTLQGYSIKSNEAIAIKLPVYNTYEGNLIIVKMYYNNELIELNKNIYTIDTTTTPNLQTITLENVPAGVYNFYFEDLAGNSQMFNGNTFLSVYMLTEVITSINSENPIDYQIYNTTVNLKIEQEKQYNTRSLTIEAKKNGEKFTPTRSSIGEYVFTEYGLYEVVIKAQITINNTNTDISKTLHFTILNENEAFKEFSYIGLNGQTINKIVRDGIDITNQIKKFVLEGNSNTELEKFNNAILYNLNLATIMKYTKIDSNTNEILVEDIYNGSGHYEIFVENQNSLIESQNFSFKVWIRDENVKILLNSSVKEGGSTTSAIKFSLNPYLIYSQIGESFVYLNDEKILDINSDSENALTEFTIPREKTGTYVVQVKTQSGNTELSYLVHKNEPLKTSTIFVIIIVSVLIVGGILIFIKLRTRLKVK